MGKPRWSWEWNEYNHYAGEALHARRELGKAISRARSMSLVNLPHWFDEVRFLARQVVRFTRLAEEWREKWEARDVE